MGARRKQWLIFKLAPKKKTRIFMHLCLFSYNCDRLLNYSIFLFLLRSLHTLKSKTPATESIFKFTLSKVMYLKMNYFVCLQTIHLCWMLQLILLKIIGCNRRQLRCRKERKANERRTFQFSLFQFNCFALLIFYYYFSIFIYFLILFWGKWAWAWDSNELWIRIIANESASKHLHFNFRRVETEYWKKILHYWAAFRLLVKWFMIANKYFYSILLEKENSLRLGIKNYRKRFFFFSFNKRNAREGKENQIIPQLLWA